MDAKWFRNSFIWLIVMVFVLAIAFQVFRNQSPSTKTIDLTGGSTSLVALIKADLQNHTQVNLTEDGQNITLQDGGPTKYQSTLGDHDNLITFLNQSGIPTRGGSFTNLVHIHVNQPSQIGNWIGTIIGFLPLLIFGALIFFMMRQAQGSNNQALSFGKSRARMFAGQPAHDHVRRCRRGGGGEAGTRRGGGVSQVSR